jgi:hypothetical protein
MPENKPEKKPEKLYDSLKDALKANAELAQELTKIRVAYTQLTADYEAVVAEGIKQAGLIDNMQRQIDELVRDAMKPAPIVVQEQAIGMRDAACALRREHISGCRCTADMRGPIA